MNHIPNSHLLTGHTENYNSKIYDEHTTKYSMKSINNILKLNYFNINDFSINHELEQHDSINKKWPFQMKNRIVQHPYFISLHDVELNNNDFSQLVDKLNRRLNRFKETIRYANRKIIFIRFELFEFDINDFIEFKNIIRSFNENLDFEIRVISYSNYKPYHELDYVKIYTLEEYKVYNTVKLESSYSNFNWLPLLNININIYKKFISLGSTFTTKINFNKYNIIEKTSLFDYLITGNCYDYPSSSFKNINNILNLNQININDLSIMHEKENVKRNNEWPFNLRYRIIQHPFFISDNDVPVECSDFTEFVNKLNIQLYTFKENIINAKEKIIFIRIEFGDFDINDFIEFKNIIILLNNNLDFEIRIISMNNYNPFHLLDYVKIYTLEKNEIKNINNFDFGLCNNFNWEVVLA